jgi:LysM repeat protein
MKFVVLFAAACIALPAPQGSLTADRPEPTGITTPTYNSAFDVPAGLIPQSLFPSAGAQSRHIVAYGETLESIASFNAMTVDQFKALNPGKSDLRAGDEVLITKPTCPDKNGLRRAYNINGASLKYQFPFCYEARDLSLSPCTKLGGVSRAVFLPGRIQIYKETYAGFVGALNQSAESLNVAQFANILQTSVSVLQDLNPDIAAVIPRNSTICAPQYNKYECKGYKINKSNEILNLLGVTGRIAPESMRTINPTISDWTAIPDGFNLCINLVNNAAVRGVRFSQWRMPVAKIVKDLNPQITNWNAVNPNEMITVPQSMSTVN